MKYLLVVGFACDVYRKEPRARVFVNNKLIDEFNIKHYKNVLTTTNNFLQNKHILQPFSLIEQLNNGIKNFPPLRFYEIEIDQEQKQLKLCIDIENNDSNYVNGFMTASSLLTLRIFYFFPLNEKILSRLRKIQNKKRLTKNYAWYRNNKNIIFDVNSADLQWHGKNKQIIKINLSNYNIGGSGYFICDLVKKYGIFIPKLKESCRYKFPKFIINYFLDKYQQYAN
jgi:hypothetical protein